MIVLCSSMYVSVRNDGSFVKDPEHVRGVGQQASHQPDLLLVDDMAHISRAGR